MPQIATRIQHFELDSERTFTEGSVRVHGIFIANASAGPVTVLINDNDGNTMLRAQVPSDDSEDFNACWLAENGLVVPTVGAGVFITIVHSQDGA